MERHICEPSRSQTGAEHHCRHLSAPGRGAGESEALLSQDLVDIPSEIIVVNNDPETVFRPSRWSKLGKLFRANPQIKLVNAQNDWMSIIRWGMVYMAHYDTVLTLDDDIVFQDKDIVKDMYDTLMCLDKYDIVSCWNSIWTQWTETEYEYARAIFLDAGIDRVDQNRYLRIRNQHLQQRVDSGCARSAASHHPRYAAGCRYGAGTAVEYAVEWHNLCNADVWAGRIPCRIPEECAARTAGLLPERHRLYKLMLENGYKPLITRETLAENSPEMKLIRRAEPTVYPW